VIQRAAQRTDSSGAVTPQRDWDNATTVTLTGVSVQPEGTAEARDAGGVEVSAQWRLFTRSGAVADVRAGDRVVWDSRSLDVVGDPQRWAGPSGGTHHWEVVLREQPVTRRGLSGWPLCWRMRLVRRRRRSAPGPPDPLSPPDSDRRRVWLASASLSRSTTMTVRAARPLCSGLGRWSGRRGTSPRRCGRSARVLCGGAAAVRVGGRRGLAAGHPQDARQEGEARGGRPHDARVGCAVPGVGARAGAGRCR
jgi:hypothetical protein